MTGPSGYMADPFPLDKVASLHNFGLEFGKSGCSFLVHSSLYGSAVDLFADSELENLRIANGIAEG